MKFDFTKCLIDIDDKPMVEVKYKDKTEKLEFYPNNSIKPDLNENGTPKMKDVLFDDVVVQALLSHREEDDKLPEEVKRSRYKLSRRIKRAKKPINLSINEMKMIKDICIERHGILISGNVCDFLEGDIEEEKTEEIDEPG